MFSLLIRTAFSYVLSRIIVEDLFVVSFFREEIVTH